MKLAPAVVVALAGCGRIGFSTTTDGAADDVGGDAAAGCLASYRLCDGFEGATFDPVWSSIGSVSIDTTVAHRGASSAHFHTDAIAVGDDGYAEIWQTRTLPLGDPTFYVRAWFRLGALPLNNMEMIAATQTVPLPDEVGLFVVPELAVYSQFSNTSTNTATRPPIGTWICALWTVTRATTPTGRISLAGDLSTTLSNVITDATTPLREMDLGIGFSGSTVIVAQPPMDVWIDDLIVAASPVSCAD
jgi:hypothetical protein